MSSSLSTWNQCRVCYLLLRRGFDVPKIVYITVWTFKLNTSHQEEGSVDSLWAWDWMRGRTLCIWSSSWSPIDFIFYHTCVKCLSDFRQVVYFCMSHLPHLQHRNYMQCLFGRSQMLNTWAWPLQLWDHNSCACLHWACARLGPVVISQGSRRAQGAYSSLVMYWPLRNAMGGITAFRWWMARTYGYTGSSVKLVKHKTNKQRN